MGVVLFTVCFKRLVGLCFGGLGVDYCYCLGGVGLYVVCYSGL